MAKKIIRSRAFGSRILRNIYNYVHRNDEIYYYPIYNINAQMSPRKLKIYNQEGEPLDSYFIRDFHRASNPYWNNGKYFIWDRYNYGLDTHFYSHQAMLETMGKPERKYGIMLESRAIAARDYDIFKMNKGLEKEFRAIFTYDDRLLNEIENARFYPACAEVWYGVGGSGAILDGEAYTNKTKNISFISSNKVMCEMHRKRIEAARYCFRNQLADVYGKAIGGDYVEIEDVLEKYRFSIIIENNQTDYYFTEKITNCFAAQVIPVYLGARKIGELFNPDGIITISEKDLENLDVVLKQCIEAEYERRLPAVLDNYQRVQEYLNMDDYLYLHYLSDD